MQRTTRTIVITVSAGVVGALALAAVPAQAAPRAPLASDRAMAGAPTVTRGDGTPAPKVLTTAPGRPIARPSRLAAGAAPDAVAKAVVADRAGQLGVRGQLRTDSVRPALGGGHVVRLQQTFDGVPVIGGEVVVDVDAAGGTRSAISETLAGTVPSTTPRVTETGATRTITALMSKYTGKAAADLVVSRPVLSLYDPAILGAPAQPGASGARLVWQAEVTGRTDLALRRQVILDATTGKKVLDLDLITEAKNRSVCDAQNQVAQIPCTSVVRGETDGPVASPDDVNKAFDYAGATYDFYSTVLGRDSIDGAGLPLKSTVRYCPDLAARYCPYKNAFWNGSQMVYGDGFASADDVVGHELTHGVTERNNGLFYYFQSGAINESLSDIFGEFVDLTDNLGNDSDAVRWQMGEDLSIGYLRNMKTPGDTNLPVAERQPDATDSPYWHANLVTNDDYFDAGGVHFNSGVGNKFAYLITDGDTFNGYAVTGLGITKAAKIVYGASQRMTSATDYRGFAAALQTSCNALVGTAGITSADCLSVDNAIKATRMNVMPPTAKTPSAPVCPAGTTTITRFDDKLDDPSSTRWSLSSPGSLSQAAAHTVSDGTTEWPLWFYGGDDTVYGPGTSPVYSGTKDGTNLWGDDADFSGGDPSAGVPTDAAIQTTAPISIPGGATYLRFTHAFGFETFNTASGQPYQNFDGGVVEYSVNGGSWKDAGPLMTGAGNNGYGYNNTLPGRGNSTIAAGFGNPLAGRPAFTWQSQGYISSRANLSSLAGKSVKFRFRVAADNYGGDYGWFIDDVSVYTCAPLLSAAPTVVTGPVTLTVPASDPVHPSTTTYRTASAAFGRALSAYSAPAAVPGSRTITLNPPKGGTACAWVTTVDSATSASTSLTRCVTLPVDDRGLKASSGWKKSSSSSAFAKTLRTATKKGKTLTLSGARGTHVVVLARTAKKGGTLGVYVNGKKVGTISLKSSRPGAKQVDLRVSGLAGGKVVLKVLKAGTVTVDGVAVRP
ncbi:MAG: M4 family metallopeptidase [Candidatus Nanopelagicales bacterium]